MSEQKIVTINGQRYDAHTGLPVASPKKALPSTKRPTAAATIHATTQKSQTLIRRLAKKPTPTKPRSGGHTMDIARSGKIARFAPHPVAKAQTTVAEAPDIAARPHPMTTKVHAKHSLKQRPVVAPVVKSSRDIKEEAIEAALAKPVPKPAKKSFFKRHPKFISITTISVVVVILGAYLTYVNIPSLSVKVAAVQAGIDATYPDYRPDGYSLNGPVTFSDGEVIINFAANTGSTKFTITQKKSLLDSSAVLNDIVRKEVGGQYNTSQAGGLTVYTFNGGNAAWVNAGILYTVKGDAPLSGEQIRRIATSL